MDCSEARVLLAGYVDGELPTPECSRLDAHVAGCPGCRRERSVQAFIHLELRREARRFPAPSALQRRLRALAEAARVEDGHSFARRWSARLGAFWAQSGARLAAPTAGLALAALLSANVVLLSSLPSKEDALAAEVVGSHVRALMGARSIDVASSDRHTVKPWFAGKLDFSPPVSDLAAEGFALVGGRLDYVDEQPVAALVYQRRKHVIDVFIWPAPGASSAPAASVARRGYNLLHWVKFGMNYWIVSDLESEELKQLERLLAATRMM
jgi:anti-sigma factor RsiW